MRLVYVRIWERIKRLIQMITNEKEGETISYKINNTHCSIG